MHEMDDRVHTDTTEVKEQISEFCVKAKDMAKEQWEEEQTPILERFKKIIEVSEEKVELSTTLHSSVSRYLQRLEKELAKYKSELEADNEGITEVLEQMAMKEPEPPESPKSLKKKTATMYDAAAFDNYSDYDAETPVDTGMETLDEYRMLLADEMNNASNSPQSVVSDLSSDLIGYIRKRKREHDPIPNNIPVTPTEVGGGFKKKRPSVFGPMHHGPPPSGGPATAGPGSANNQLRYNMGYYHIWVSRGLVITIFGYHVGWLLPYLGGMHHVPPPSDGPTTAGPGSANNQLRLNKKLEYQSSAEVFEVDWQYVDPNEPLYCICNQKPSIKKCVI
eukprot:sb/3466566/